MGANFFVLYKKENTIMAITAIPTLSTLGFVTDSSTKFDFLMSNEQPLIVNINDLINNKYHFDFNTKMIFILETKTIECVVEKTLLFKYRTNKFNKSYGVYLIINSLSGELYVGSTSNVISRISKHRRELCIDSAESKRLQNSFNSTNNNFFDICAIYTDNRDDAYEIEQIILDIIIPKTISCNISPNARIACKGITLSDEHKQKIINANTGRIRTKESLEKSSKSLTGLKRSKEIKEKFSKIHLGVPLQPHHAKAVRDSRVKIMKKVQINNIIYNNLGDAAKALKIGYSALRYRLNSKSRNFSNYFYLNKKKDI